jgi:hypothetical protein
MTVKFAFPAIHHMQHVSTAHHEGRIVKKMVDDLLDMLYTLNTNWFIYYMHANLFDQLLLRD